MDSPAGSPTVSISSWRRSFFSLHRNQVVSMDNGLEQQLHEQVDLFQTHVAGQLLSLIPTSSNQPPQPLLSWHFLQKLLAALLSCDHEFNALLPLLTPAPHPDRAASNLLDRTVKSLDICNALSHSLDALRHRHRLALIAAHNPNRALDMLFIRSTQLRTRSSSNISPVSLASPREPGSGLALAMYTMSYMLVFSMWVLMLAFPCGERAAVAPVAPPRQVAWAGPMGVVVERIGEEVRRSEKKGAPLLEGLLAEMQEVEGCAREMMEVLGSKGAGEEMAAMAGELGERCRRLEAGMGPFEWKVREVFHRLVTTRGEIIRCLNC